MLFSLDRCSNVKIKGCKFQVEKVVEEFLREKTCWIRCRQKRVEPETKLWRCKSTIFESKCRLCSRYRY